MLVSTILLQHYHLQTTGEVQAAHRKAERVPSLFSWGADEGVRAERRPQV